jgi:hypothetical protein
MADPDDAMPRELRERLRAYAGSDLRAEERELAASGTCPRPEEVAALQAGRIPEPERRRLAEHLLSCPRCVDANLAQLAPTPAAATAFRRWRPWLAAAALLLAVPLLWFALRGPAPSVGLGDVYWVSESGIIVRAEPPPVDAPRRVLVEVRAGGHVALVLTEDGTPRSVAVEGDRSWAAVSAGEEVVLPLDRALAIPSHARCLVVFAPEPLSDAALADAARRVLRGEAPPSGVAVVTVGDS